MELLQLFFDVFWNFFSWLDSIYLIGTLSILKVLVIVFLFTISFKFLFPHKNSGS